MKHERWPVSWWTALTPPGQDVVLVVLLLGYGLTALRETGTVTDVTPDGPIVGVSYSLLDHPWTVLLVLLTTVPLLLRRRWPTAVMVVIVAALIAVDHVGVRVLLGGIRRGDTASRQPEPGLDQLDWLLDHARRAGHHVELGLRDRVQAVVLAYESGLVQPGSQ